MKKVIILIAFISIFILTVGCSSDYKTMSYGNTKFKVPSKSTEETSNNQKFITFPSGGMLLPQIDTSIEIDNSLLEYIANSITDQMSNEIVYNQKSTIYNGTKVIEVWSSYNSLQMITYYFIHGKYLTTFVFAQKNTISADFGIEINTVMNSIKDKTK